MQTTIISDRCLIGPGLRMQRALERAEAEGHYGALLFLRGVAARRLQQARYWPRREVVPCALFLRRGAIQIRSCR